MEQLEDGYGACDITVRSAEECQMICAHTPECSIFMYIKPGATLAHYDGEKCCLRRGIPTKPSVSEGVISGPPVCLGKVISNDLLSKVFRFVLKTLIPWYVPSTSYPHC